MQVCPACGRDNADNASQCAYCHAALPYVGVASGRPMLAMTATVQATAAASNAPPTQVSRTRSLRAVVFAVIGCLLGAAAGALPFFVAPHPGGAVGLLLIIFVIGGTILFAGIGSVIGARAARVIP